MSCLCCHTCAVTPMKRDPRCLLGPQQDGPATYHFLTWLKSQKGHDYYFPASNLKIRQ